MSYSDYYNLIKIYIIYIFSYFFLLKSPKIDAVLQVTSFHAKKLYFFASNYGIVTDIEIKLCK